MGGGSVETARSCGGDTEAVEGAAGVDLNAVRETLALGVTLGRLDSVAFGGSEPGRGPSPRMSLGRASGAGLPNGFVVSRRVGRGGR
jgi:hypothetical protein